MRLRSPLLLLACAAGVAAQPLYDFSSSPVQQLTDATFESDMVKDTTSVWVVEYYADWCGHCKAFAKDFERAASNLQGIVKFGAVNADSAKATMMAAGVQGYPTVKVYLPETTRNPYTGKLYKPSLDFSGPRKARALVDFASAAVPSSVVQVPADKVSEFAANGTLPKALLFTSKSETTTLLKALSLSLSGRMLIGETRAEKESAAAKSFNVETYPSLYLLQPEGEHLLFTGELKPQSLRAFLEEHAAPAPSDDGAAADQGGALVIDEAVFKSEVEPSQDAWVLFVSESEAPTSTAEADELALALFGQARVGVAASSLAPRLNASPGSVVALPFGTGAKSKAKAKAFAADAVADAKKAALDSLPDNLVDRLSASTVDAWIGGALSTSQTKAICLLFSEKSEVPPLFRSISLTFDGKLGFAMLPATLMPRFNVQKAPALLVMFGAEAADSKEGGMQLQGMQFTPQMHGKFSYGNIANFVGQFVEMRLAELGASGGDAPPKPEPTPKPNKDLGPIPELSAETFEEECTSKGGLCAIALIDGGSENVNKESQLQMLTGLRKRKAGGPLAFSWVDATCHPAFAAHFDLSEMDLPTMVVMSPSKLRWARAIGAFDAETLGTFGSGVATGRIPTNEMKALPPLEAGVDCATVKRGADVVEDDGLADEIMAEILEEERRAREAREAEAAAASAASTQQKDAAPTRQLSELEKMERDLEECSAHDLLCAARREKQLAKIEKKRALEEKLREIAKKKKKKAKKKKAA